MCWDGHPGLWGTRTVIAWSPQVTRKVIPPDSVEGAFFWGFPFCPLGEKILVSPAGPRRAGYP